MDTEDKINLCNLRETCCGECDTGHQRYKVQNYVADKQLLCAGATSCVCITDTCFDTHYLTCQTISNSDYDHADGLELVTEITEDLNMFELRTWNKANVKKGEASERTSAK